MDRIESREMQKERERGSKRMEEDVASPQWLKWFCEAGGGLT